MPGRGCLHRDFGLWPANLCDMLLGMKTRLSVRKHGVPKTLAFEFGLRLRSKTRVLGRRAQRRGCDSGPCVVKRWHRRALASQSALRLFSCDLEASLGPGLALRRIPCRKETWHFAFALLNPLTTPSGKVQTNA